jgi:tRNA-splicing ligase RtcB (3'-phosphate/5'-hydroxy nucleic acid ligase)
MSINLRKIDPLRLLIEQDEQMCVPAMIYTSDQLPLEETAVAQLRDAACLPPACKVLATPDIHQGFGVPIGCVMALRDAIMPAAVGYDINCGVRLLATPLSVKSCKVDEIAHSIAREIPLGEGKSNIKISDDLLDEILSRGVAAVETLAGRSSHRILQAFDADEFQQDMQRVEKNGSLPGRPEFVSGSAKSKGGDQLGTLGGGNHFIEIQQVHTIFDRALADRFNLQAGQITVMIHSGSRRLGYEVADEYMRLAARARGAVGHEKELAYLTQNETDFERYIGAMNAAGNFAYVNRQLMMLGVRRCFRWVHGPIEMPLIYDVSHNMAQREEHLNRQVWVHRKGATRSFGPRRMPGLFHDVGQPVIIPGSMGTASYLLVGADGSEEALSSVNHGAGRTMSRTAAMGKKDRKTGKYVRAPAVTDDQFRQSMAGITLIAQDKHSVKEEAPAAYKDIDEVIRVVTETGLARPVARMIPLAVLKG